MSNVIFPVILGVVIGFAIFGLAVVAEVELCEQESNAKCEFIAVPEKGE